MYHMRIFGDLLDHDLLVAFDGQLRASASASLSGDLPDHSWRQGSGLGLRMALGIALPAYGRPLQSCHHGRVRRAPTQPSRALSRRFRRTRLNSYWDSLTKPSFPGATSSLGSKTPCSPLRPFGTLAASLLMMATMSIPWPGNA